MGQFKHIISEGSQPGHISPLEPSEPQLGIIEVYSPNTKGHNVEQREEEKHVTRKCNTFNNGINRDWFSLETFVI